MPRFYQDKGLKRLCCAALQVHGCWLVGPCRQGQTAAIVFWPNWGSQEAAWVAAAALPLQNPLQLLVSLGQVSGWDLLTWFLHSSLFPPGAPSRRQQDLLLPLVHLCQKATDVSLPLCCAAASNEATTPCEQPDRLRLLLQGLQLHLGAWRVSAMEAPSLAAGRRLQCSTASGKQSLVYEICTLWLAVAGSAKAPFSSPQAVLLLSVVCGRCGATQALYRPLHLI